MKLRNTIFGGTILILGPITLWVWMASSSDTSVRGAPPVSAEARCEDWSMLGRSDRVDLCSELGRSDEYMQDCIGAGVDARVCECATSHVVAQLRAAPPRQAPLWGGYPEYLAICDRWAMALGIIESR